MTHTQDVDRVIDLLDPDKNVLFNSTTDLFNSPAGATTGSTISKAISLNGALRP